jgi:hypothetical protein
MPFSADAGQASPPWMPVMTIRQMASATSEKYLPEKETAAWMSERT